MIAQRHQPPGGTANPVTERRAVELDVLTSEDLRLPGERQVITILGDNDVGDQRVGGDAAGDDAWGRRCLDDAIFAYPAAVARPPGDEHPQGRRDDIEALGDILADGMESAAAAGAGLVVDVDDLLDALEMRRQAATVGLARPSRTRRSRFDARLDPRQRRAELLEHQLELVAALLLRAGTEPVPLERGDDRV